jgi:hypothetical protein
MVAIAGCGNSRTPAPSVYHPLAPAKGFPAGFHPFAPAGYGFGMEVPKNWTNLQNQVAGPVVMIVASGSAVVAVSHYARTVPPPADSTELQQDESALLAAVKAKDTAFRLLSSRTLTLAGRPTVELGGLERISGQLRRVNSYHLFLPHSELVLEEYASPAAFGAVNRQVFSHVTTSFVLLPGSHA